MKSANIKRSVGLNGHKTSISLEQEFWEGLRAIAAEDHLPLPLLLQRIDTGRTNANLSSAIRVYVLSRVQATARAALHVAAQASAQLAAHSITPSAVADEPGKTGQTRRGSLRPTPTALSR